MQKKIDLTKTHRPYYTATTTPTLITFPQAQYLSITGEGDPASPVFTEALQNLYPVAYTVKFMCKDAGNDFTVPKLEGLWWFDGNYEHLSPAETPLHVPREAWRWRLLLRMPDFVTPQLAEQAISTATTKKKLSHPDKVSFFTLNEGKCVQMLHIGPFDREPETLREMQTFMQTQGLNKNGHHHEIYLSDLRKTVPQKLKTILREPVQ